MQFAERISKTLQRYPFLVAERGGVIAGFAYAGALRERAAYARSAETTVYLKQGCKKQGIGSALYTALENILAEQGILNLYACVAYSEQPDEYLAKDSVLFHERMGFRTVGRFNLCGSKFGRWYDVLWMEKLIAGHTKTPPELKSFGEVRDLIDAKYGIK